MSDEIAARCLRALEFWNKHGLAAAMDYCGKSRRTLHYWKKSYREGGLCGLMPRSSAITHLYTYPKSPKMNAVCERFNRTIQEQFVDFHENLLFEDLPLFNQKLADWLVQFFPHPLSLSQWERVGERASVTAWLVCRTGCGWRFLHNALRPHKALQLKTPVQYISDKCQFGNMWRTHTASCKASN